MTKTANIEKRIARRFIRDTLKAGYTLDVNDGGETTLRQSTNLAAIIDAMFSTALAEKFAARA